MIDNIHEMTSGDIEAVIALWQATPGVGLDTRNDSRDGIEKYLARNPGLSFVCKEEQNASDRIIGAVLCGHDGRRGYLHHLAVAPDRRRHGLGTALVDKCLSALASQGIGKCNIFVYSDNREGQSFWKRVGWNTRADLLLMQRPLSIDGGNVQ